MTYQAYHPVDSPEYPGRGIFRTTHEYPSQSPVSRLPVPVSTILGTRVHGVTTGIEATVPAAAAG